MHFHGVNEFYGALMRMPRKTSLFSFWRFLFFSWHVHPIARFMNYKSDSVKTDACPGTGRMVRRDCENHFSTFHANDERREPRARTIGFFLFTRYFVQQSLMKEGSIQSRKILGHLKKLRYISYVLLHSKGAIKFI